MRRSLRRLALLIPLFLLPAGGAALAATAHASAEPGPVVCVEPFPPPPGAAFALFLTGKSPTTVALAWPRPLQCVARYDLFQGGRLVLSTKDTFARVTGLTPATTYTFTARAIDFDGRVRAVTPPLTVTTLPA